MTKIDQGELLENHVQPSLIWVEILLSAVWWAKMPMAGESPRSSGKRNVDMVKYRANLSQS